jgi:hypothetical protein
MNRGVREEDGSFFDLKRCRNKKTREKREIGSNRRWILGWEIA